jgi:hypothetical protein
VLERKHVKAKSENYFLSLISLRDWLTNGALMLLDRRRSHGQEFGPPKTETAVLVPMLC